MIALSQIGNPFMAGCLTLTGLLLSLVGIVLQRHYGQKMSERTAELTEANYKGQVMPLLLIFVERDIRVMHLIKYLHLLAMTLYMIAMIWSLTFLATRWLAH